MFAPLSKPPLHNKKDFVLPKITNNNKPQHYIRSNSNASSHNLKNEDSFSHMISNDDSNNVSYISTNSNSSIGLNKKPITFKNVKNFKEK